MLTEVLLRVVVVVGVLLPVSMALFVGRERLRTTRSEWLGRLRASAPTIVALAVVLFLNRRLRQYDFEDGIYMTAMIRELEGEFVLLFQEIARPELTVYFSAVYVFGYTFLLIFPALAYFSLSDTRPFRRLLAAYALNYAIGLVLYALVIAYGPRNILAGDELVTLYDFRPEYQHLTREVNRNTNVFPSLHTSLSATVAIFAYHTRSSYPKWFPVAVVLAASVIVSTMYLAIHWATDVVGGLVLAGVCVGLARVLVDRWSLSALSARLTGGDG